MRASSSCTSRSKRRHRKRRPSSPNATARCPRLADLKSKRIAITKAVGSRYRVLAARAHIKLAPPNDAAFHYLTPADGRATFERGSVDAWITRDPYIASVDANDVRIPQPLRTSVGIRTSPIRSAQQLRCLPAATRLNRGAGISLQSVQFRSARDAATTRRAMKFLSPSLELY